MGLAVWQCGDLSQGACDERTCPRHGCGGGPARAGDMASVTIKNLKKIYDNKVTAVHDVNIEIKDQEFIVLVGPSGCGKSTTLRMVAGLEDISEGDLFIGDKRCNDVAPKDRDIAMVFQSYALYPRTRSTRRSTRPRRFWASPSTWTGSRRRCPAASVSVWPSGVPSCVSRRCC